MGKLLQTLGDGYKFETLPMDEFLRPESLDKFDVVFLTCNGWPSTWAESLGADGDRPGVAIGTARPDAIKRCGETLRRFVERGGTLYASDMRDELVLWAFPARVSGVELDEQPLPELQEAERAWLKAKVPLAKVGTVAETLQGVELSPAVKQNLTRLTAIVEASSLVKGEKEEPESEAVAIVPRLCRRVSIPATDDDLRAIAAAMLQWYREIRGTLLAPGPETTSSRARARSSSWSASSRCCATASSRTARAPVASRSRRKSLTPAWRKSWARRSRSTSTTTPGNPRHSPARTSSNTSAASTRRWRSVRSRRRFW